MSFNSKNVASSDVVPKTEFNFESESEFMHLTNFEKHLKTRMRFGLIIVKGTH